MTKQLIIFIQIKLDSSDEKSTKKDDNDSVKNSVSTADKVPVNTNSATKPTGDDVSNSEISDDKGTNGSGGDGKMDEKKDSNGSSSGAKKDTCEDRLVTLTI